MNKAIISTLVLLSALSLTAHADEGFYGGIGVGQATNDACDVVIEGVDCDDSETAWKGLLGYGVNDNLGFELSYASIGGANASATTGERASIDGKAFALSAVGSIDFNEHFGAFAKVGAANWNADATVFDGTTSFDSDDDGTDLTYGIGLKWNIERGYDLRLTWERYDLDFDNFDGVFDDSSEADVISLVYVFNF